jgi:flagellar hook-associated protein 2
LTSAITNHFSDIAKLFAPYATSTDAQVSYVGSTTKTQSGTYAVDITTIGSSSVNTVGTINGVAGVGAGTYLTGAIGDASEGLKLSITGNTTGSRGSVTFSRGYAGELESVLKSLLDEEGILETKTDGINSSIARLDKQTDAINIRLAAIEKRYRAQFARLDAVLASLQNTSSYLTQQISALSNNN